MATMAVTELSIQTYKIFLKNIFDEKNSYLLKCNTIKQFNSLINVQTPTIEIMC